MKKKCLNVVLVIFMFILFSCESNSPYPVKYERDRFVNGNIHLYAQGGEVSDSTKIYDFIEMIKNDFSMFDINVSLDSNIQEYYKSDFSIELISDTKARFTLANGKTQDFSILRKKGTIFFVKDSVESTNSYYAFTDVWAKFKPYIVSVESIPFGQVTNYKSTIFAYEFDDEIQFPILSFMGVYMPYRLHTVEYVEEVHQREQNSMSDDFLERIKNGIYPEDSIVFRESRIIFSKI